MNHNIATRRVFMLTFPSDSDSPAFVVRDWLASLFTALLFGLCSGPYCTLHLIIVSVHLTQQRHNSDLTTILNYIFSEK